MHPLRRPDNTFGGLPTPRTAADLTGGDGYAVLQGLASVLAGGVDVSRHFVRGARQCLTIARAQHIRAALLKSGSPSCGAGPPAGVTAALLVMHGISITEID